jgi:hypothetical protein
MCVSGDSNIPHKKLHWLALCATSHQENQMIHDARLIGLTLMKDI